MAPEGQGKASKEGGTEPSRVVTFAVSPAFSLSLTAQESGQGSLGSGRDWGGMQA